MKERVTSKVDFKKHKKTQQVHVNSFPFKKKLFSSHSLVKNNRILVFPINYNFFRNKFHIHLSKIM